MATDEALRAPMGSEEPEPNYPRRSRTGTSSAAAILASVLRLGDFLHVKTFERNLRGQRRQPGRLPRGRPAPRPDPPCLADRRAPAAKLDATTYPAVGLNGRRPTRTAPR